MTGIVKNIILWKLRLLVRVYLSIKNIEIVAITGSAGKTTAKITVGQILPESTIYVPKEAYNTEYGVPLALFEEKVPENPKNLAAWAGVIWRMFIKLFIRPPYKRLVLEYGADKPGDIHYLTSMAPPHIALVTTVLPVHLEGFRDVEAVANEKSQLVTCLGVEDFAILNFDNDYVREMAKQTKARVISFGKKGADIEYSALKYNETGMAFDITWKGSKYPVHIPVAAPQLLPSYLGAFAIGIVLGADPKGLVHKLNQITPEKGRMNVLVGLSDSTLIDDSYNSNPESAKAALEVLSHFPGRKIAVLGSMNELGGYAKKGHAEVGAAAAKTADIVLIVGKTAIEYMYPVILAKLNKKVVQRFNTSKEAGEYLKTIIEKGDVVLFKGSQNGVFTEEAVKCVLAKPDKASELLVRQGPMWQNKKGKL
jgi:UDP-N-acetylmuramoyl-tripeptide--D-alanyl-D-alanine ligase